MMVMSGFHALGGRRRFVSPLRGSTEWKSSWMREPWVGTHGYGCFTAKRFKPEVEVSFGNGSVI